MSAHVLNPFPTVTAPGFKEKKAQGKKTVFLTAYDFWSARILAKSGVDGILVGDSLGNVIQGQNSTIPVSLAQMIYHANMVRRGAPDIFTVLDMPFGTVTADWRASLKNCVRAFRESQVHALKIEGLQLETIRACQDAGIPVMGHLGLTPQFIQVLGSFRKHGKSEKEADAIFEASKQLESAGIFALVLEMVESSVALEITKTLEIPTVGIGSGDQTDSQILVSFDLWGITENSPKFAPRMAEMGQVLLGATKKYLQEVRGT